MSRQPFPYGRSRVMGDLLLFRATDTGVDSELILLVFLKLTKLIHDLAKLNIFVCNLSEKASVYRKTQGSIR